MIFSLRYCRTVRGATRIAGLATGLLAVLFPTFVFAADWRLVRASGDVRIHGEDGQWVKAKSKQALKPGDSIWTGRGSRALIETDDGAVLLKSRSLVKVPAQKLPDGMVVLFQGQGKVTATVRKKETQHFSVQTPFLAAVVKGTEFTVDMGSRGSRSTRLSVSDGIVGAVDTHSGDAIDVRAGQSLTTSHTPGKSLANARPESSRSRDNGPGENAGSGNGDDPDGREGPQFDRDRGNSGGGGSGGGGSGGGHGHGHGHGHHRN